MNYSGKMRVQNCENCNWNEFIRDIVIRLKKEDGKDWSRERDERI